MIILPHEKYEFGNLIIPGYSFDVYVNGVKVGMVCSVDTERLVYSRHVIENYVLNQYVVKELKATYIGIFPSPVNPKIEICTN